MHDEAYKATTAHSGNGRHSNGNRHGILRMLGRKRATPHDERWQRAEDFTARHDAGEIYREIGADWINEQTGEPYSMAHVVRYVQVWQRYGHLAPEDRPTFPQAYQSTSPQRSVNGHVTTTAPIAAPTPLSPEHCQRLINTVAELEHWCLAKADLHADDPAAMHQALSAYGHLLKLKNFYTEGN